MQLDANGFPLMASILLKGVIVKKRVLTSVMIFAALGVAHTTASSQEKCIDVLNRMMQARELIKFNPDRLAYVLKNLDERGALPREYVTEVYARTNCGWRPDYTLWGINQCNGKILGGDPYIDSNRNLPPQARWFTADIYNIKGFRAPPRLLYSPDSKMRFITPDVYRSFIPIPECTTRD